jgi:hypothetical protein
MRLRFWIALLFFAPALATSATPEILVTAFHGKQWQVRYDFDAPVTSFRFARTPDDSRSRDWLPDIGFEIASNDGADLVRRKDGAAFTSVRFRMNPAYRVLPQDYAPFSPFSDGATLFHTGRFFACTEKCAEDATWKMTLWAGAEDRIVLDGRVVRAEASWIDTADGQVIYVGTQTPVQTRDFVTVIDPGVPEQIRSQLLVQLPRLMHTFAQKFGALPTKPTLFVSYDARHPQGWGRQGGVLPGQVFTHFYGSKWVEEMQKDSFADELSWHLAHEAAHLYQHQQFSNEDPWIHEGSAEAFAALALQSEIPAYVEAKRSSAAEACRDQRKGKSIRDAIAAGTFDAAYSCGLLVNLEIDAAVRKSENHDGLFAVWKNYLGLLKKKGATADEATYLEAIEAVGSKELADWTRATVKAPSPEFLEDTTKKK